LDTVSVEPIFEKSKSDPVIILDVNVPWFMI
jgi:hypothetical protein